MRSRASGSEQIEMMCVDFSNAFNMLPLRRDEKPFVVVKGADGSYYAIQVVCFGLSPGPLLWARVAAAGMRLAQSTMLTQEGRLQCFVDEPLILACANSKSERTRVFLRCLLLWAVLGLDLAWHKSQRGFSLTWIG